MTDTIKYEVILISKQICNIILYSRINVKDKENEKSEAEDKENENSGDEDIETEDSETDASESS